MTLQLPYLDFHPVISNAVMAADAATIGRVRLGKNVSLGPLVTLRGDGHDIDVGDDCRFLDRATVHIADQILPTRIGNRVTLGRFALAHACTVGDGCIFGDAAVVMDGSVVGEGTLVTAGSLVPPGKTLDPGMIYDGNPARPVRPLPADERERLRADLIAGAPNPLVCSETLPPLTMSPYRPDAGSGPLYSLAGESPKIDPASYVAPTAVVAGDVAAAPDVSIWFATAIYADGAKVTIGPRSNVQDNSLLITDASRGSITIGADVTVGHNVLMGSCHVGDGCLIGMGAEMGDNVTVEDGAIVGARAWVEPGTVVEAGWVWAGRPAKAFRPVKPEEAKFFERGKTVYIGYTQSYLEQQARA